MTVRHAAQVAAAATVAIAIVYMACVTVLNLVVSAHLTAQANGRLAARLAELERDPADITQQVSSPGIAPDADNESSPVTTWLVGPGGQGCREHSGGTGAAARPDHARPGQQVPGLVQLVVLQGRADDHAAAPDGGGLCDWMR